MADVSKLRFARSLKNRLNALGCPYTQGAEDSWITELVFKPGEPRIRLLQWLLSKYDLMVGEMVDNSQAAVTGSRMDSRIQRLLFVASNLGLCRYDDVDIIRGVDSSTPGAVNKQIAFMDRLLDIIMIHDAAEDPMTKSLLSPGVVSESSPLEDQVQADCRYVDAVTSMRLPGTMLTSTVDLIPHDILRLMRQEHSGSPDVPSLHKLTEMCSTAEKNLSRRLEVLQELQEVRGEQSGGQLQRAGQSLQLVMGEVSQLVLSFTYCYENEMLPWCRREPPHLSQLGPLLRRVHALTQQFAQMLQGLHKIRQSYRKLSDGVTDKLTVTDNTYSAFLAEAGQTVVSSLQDCVDILETSVQHEHSSISTSLCSSMLRL
ncbi:uncharacterized protein LOC143285220 [Babylonia areolata]|uniref:uncharacterized protein LOC143285220 n=1 Tax=Babylonia areolata TaxID=304850 RepID=UPI003FD21994